MRKLMTNLLILAALYVAGCEGEEEEEHEDYGVLLAPAVQVAAEETISQNPQIQVFEYDTTVQRDYR